MFNVKYTIDKKGVPEEYSRGCVTVEIELIDMASHYAKTKILNEFPFLGLSESDINIVQITSPIKMKEYLSFNYKDIEAHAMA
jgi:hypothetical protein